MFVPDPAMRREMLIMLSGRGQPDVVPGLIQTLRFVRDEDGWIDRTLVNLTG